MIERNAFHHVYWAPFVKQQILTDVGLFVIDFREKKIIAAEEEDIQSPELNVMS